MHNPTFKSTLRKLKALSDGTRIKLLAMLAVKSLCVCELTCALGLAQPTVSRHLKQLEDAGFLSSHREGTWTIYSLEPEDELSRQMLDLVLARVLSDIECMELIKKLDGIDRCTISGGGKNCKGRSV